MTFTLFGSLSQVIRLDALLHIVVLTPRILLLSVWPLPLSLATTSGISFDFSSSPYLDVSVQGVPLDILFDSYIDLWFFITGVPTFGNLRVKAYLQLTAAYRSLSRPSSAPNAKAFSIYSSSLELPLVNLHFRVWFTLVLRFFSLELLCVSYLQFTRLSFYLRLAKLFNFYPYGKTWFQF